MKDGFLRKLFRLSIFAFLVRNRWVVGLLCVGLLLFVIPLCAYLYQFTAQHWRARVTKEEVDHLIHVVDGVASLFVALGVIIESRSILRHSYHATPPADDYEAKLDHHAEGEGLEILCAGLMMEVLTEVLDMPDSMVNVQTWEFAFSGAILIFAIYALICCVDLAIGSLVRKYLAH